MKSMEISQQDYEKLLKENELLRGMVDTAIEEFLYFYREHGIVLVNNVVFCEDYDTIFQCLKDRTLKRQSRGSL